MRRKHRMPRLTKPNPRRYPKHLHRNPKQHQKFVSVCSMVYPAKHCLVVWRSPSASLVWFVWCVRGRLMHKLDHLEAARPSNILSLGELPSPWKLFRSSRPSSKVLRRLCLQARFMRLQSVSTKDDYIDYKNLDTQHPLIHCRTCFSFINTLVIIQPLQHLLFRFSPSL